MKPRPPRPDALGPSQLPPHARKPLRSGSWSGRTSGCAAFESVYLARHGQTVWNLTGRQQGRLDSPLTPEGARQVRRNAAAVRHEPVDALFSSPLERARTSAAVFAAALGMPVTVLDELSEVDHGELSGLSRAEIAAAWPGQAGHSPGSPVPGRALRCWCRTR
jgi:Histidine phosphatase superfamily (branch 1)